MTYNIEINSDSFLFLAIAIMVSAGFITGRCDCRTENQLKAISCSESVELENDE